MFSFLSVGIFFGCIFTALIILIVTYFCVKNGQCCWHSLEAGGKKKKKTTKREGDELSIIAGELDDDDLDESDNGSFFNKPYLMTPQTTVYRKLVNEPDLADQDPAFHIQGISKTKTNNKSKNKYLGIESVKSFQTGYTSTEEEDPGTDTTDISGAPAQTVVNKQKTHKEFVDGARIRFSLLYSKSDLFLMLTVNEVEGIPGKITGGYEFLRVSVALLPKKKYRSKTKYVFQSEAKAVFDESFKFSNVSRENLFSSSFRLRLQGKKTGRDTTLGEVVVHLADVAQRAGGFMTWRTFDKVKR